MTIFGVVHKDPSEKSSIVYRLPPRLTVGGFEWISGDSFAFGASSKIGTNIACDELFSQGGLHIVFSGEITNHRDFVDAGKNLSGRQDFHAPLFVNLYRQFGSDSVSKTSGQFCAAIWDEKTETLRLFLDRSGGIKALYYALLPNGFAFCSSLNLLMSACRLDKKINSELIQNLFATGYILPPRTLFKGVYKICPGEEVLYRNGEVKARIVDRIFFNSSKKQFGTADELTDRLTDSLARLTVEPEVGFLLSGGIDSSILVALTAQKLKKPVLAFSASFPGSEFDESAYARIVANDNDCSCNLVDLSQANALDDLPEIVWNLGEPFLDFSAIPTFHLLRQVKKRTSIIISGDGPDHLFGRYYPLAAKRYVGARYRKIVKMLGFLPVSFPAKIRNASNVSLFEAYSGLFSGPAWGSNARQSLSCLLNMKHKMEFGAEPFYSSLEIPPETDMAGFMDAVATLDFYVDGACGVFAKVGRMAEANGLLIREPYLDRSVSDYIANLSLSQKQGGSLLHLLASKSHSKQLLKHGVGFRCLPMEIINKKKGGFTPPLSAWLRETVCTLPASRLLSDAVKENEYFDINQLDQILQEHRHGVRDWAQIIFLVISFDLWVRLFVASDNDVFPNWKLMDLYEQ